jgi:iron complex outermembrane receptor protein
MMHFKQIPTVYYHLKLTSKSMILLVTLAFICTFLPVNTVFGQIQASSSSISGIVVDATSDEPLEFATVVVIGTRTTVQTNKSGEFRLVSALNASSKLRISMIGYEIYELDLQNYLGSTNSIVIRLNPSVSIIDEVVVTGSPTGSGFRYQPAQAFNKAQLSQRQDVSVGHMLDGEPGVAMRSFGPAPSRPVIRGLDGERILILENGERMGDISESAADHAVALDPGAMNRIEIVRGPASLLYGNSAMGGVINLITNDIPNDWTVGTWGSVSGNVASVNSLGMTSARLGYGNESYAVTGRGSVRGASDLQTPSGRIPGTGLTTYEGSAGFGFKSDNIQGGITVMGMDSGYGIPGDPNDVNEIEIRFQRTAMQYRLDAQRDAFFDKIQIKGHLSLYDQQEVDIQLLDESTVEDIPLTYSQQSISSTLYIQHRPVGILDRGVVGFNINGRIMDVGGLDAYTPGDQYLNFALFTFQEVPISSILRLQAGLRLDSRSIKTRFIETQESDQTGTINTDLAGSIGINLRPSIGLEMGIQLAKAHRYPTIEELYSDGVHLGAGSYERGNQDLKTESGYGLDVFVSKSYGKWVAELTGYSMWIQNFIRFEPTGLIDTDSGFPVFEYRAGSARLVGSEFQVSGQIGSNWTIRSSADLVFGDVTGASGHPLPTIPPARINNTLRYDNQGWWAQIRVKHVLKQNRVAPDEMPTNGYTLLGGAIGIQVGKESIHRVILRVDNAFNASYRDHLSRIEDRGQLMPGRNVSLIYTFDF